MPRGSVASWNIGRFNKRLTIQEDVSITANVFGELVPSWRTLEIHGKCWGQLEQISGRELLSSQQVIGEITTVVTIRWRADLATALSRKNRFIVDETQQILEIISVTDPDGRRRILVCACGEVAD
jgi:SPP1 family predicted phage head-tail adaptor